MSTARRRALAAGGTFSLAAAAVAGSVAVPSTVPANDAVLRAAVAPRAVTPTVVDPVRRRDPRPNVLYIVTDDQATADLNARTMPAVTHYLVNRGTVYRNSVTSYAYCCPSRASFQTGEYTQNHGVRSCQPGSGYAAFRRLVPQRSTLPVWLRRAGYSTGFTGKFINGYEDDYRHVPAGWTDWHAFGAGTYNYWNQTEVVKRPGRSLTTVRHHTYTSDTTGTIASSMIRDLGRRGKPWFVEAAFVAPHHGSDGGESDNPTLDNPGVAPRWRDAWHGHSMPKNPSFDEADVSDKNALVRRRPLLAPYVQRELQEVWEQRQEAIRSVDANVARLIATLRRTGQLGNTVVVFTSDNGYDLGDHRKVDGKMSPYRSSTSVPLAIRGPGFPAGARPTMPVQTVDVTATIARLARAHPLLPQDGVSIAGAAHRPAAHRDRVTLLRQYLGMRYAGAHTRNFTYLRVHDGLGTEELYDHRVDRWETTNLAGRPAYAGVLAELRAQTTALARCSGASCHRTTTANQMVSLATARRVLSPS